jgi:molybdenum cofactor cytidylyltransferase
MNASLAAGLAHLSDTAACLVLLPDMPWVDEPMLVALRDVWDRERPLLAISRYGGVMAPPTLFSRALYAELAAGGRGDRRGRELVRRHRARARVVDWPRERLADVDTPADWAALHPGKR